MSDQIGYVEGKLTEKSQGSTNGAVSVYYFWVVDGNKFENIAIPDALDAHVAVGSSVRFSYSKGNHGIKCIQSVQVEQEPVRRFPLFDTLYSFALAKGSSVIAFAIVSAIVIYSICAVAKQGHTSYWGTYDGEWKFDTAWWLCNIAFIYFFAVAPARTILKARSLLLSRAPSSSR